MFKLTVTSDVRIVFFSFRIESNSYRWSQKSPVVSTCEINSTVFMVPHYSRLLRFLLWEFQYLVGHNVC